MEAILIIIIAIFTFASRVANLLNIPIFTDEAIYIRWAQIGLADPAHRYISLTDGKQPLLTWLMYPMLKIFSDPLFAGRFVSVLSGVSAVVGIYFVARSLFGRKVALFATIIYFFSPFALVYDRLALMDSLLSSLGIWSLYLEILLIRHLRLDVALLLGVTIGAGVLTKSSAFFYLYLLPASLLLFDFKIKKKFKRFLRWLGLSAVSFTIVQIMYNSLRLSPWFYIIEQKNYTFIFTFQEFLQKAPAVFLPNLGGLFSFLFSYITLPIGIVIAIGIILGILRKDKRLIFLFLWFLFPFLLLSAFAKVLFPRFILFMVMPLFVIAAYILANLTVFAYQKMKILLFIIPLVLAYPAYQSYLLIASPVESAIPSTDKNQLFDDWPSGYGVKKVISFLSQRAKDKKIVIGTEGTFGLNPTVYEIYLGLNKNVEIYGFWPVSEVPQKLLEEAEKYPTYLIFKEKQVIPEDWPLTLIAKYRRGKGETFLLFYQVNPKK